MNKKITIFLVLFYSFLFFPQSSFSFRVSGGELTYSYNTSTGKYDFTLVAYANCSSPIPFLNQYSIFYKSTICNKEGSFSVAKVSEVILGSNCKSFKTTCEGGSSFGIKKLIYRGVFEEKELCEDWKFSWIECNRNLAINTIVQNNGGVCLYIEAKLNNKKSQNNAAKFSNDPQIIVCNGVNRLLNFKASDADGDSLQYSLINAKQNSISNISYQSGLNGILPINSSVPININSKGEVNITPTLVGQKSVFVVKVDELRSGTLVGSTLRDIQINVEGCENNLPSITGFNRTNNYSIDVCVRDAEEQCFFLETNDLDANDSEVHVRFIQKLPGQTDEIKVLNNNKKKKEIYACWYPTLNQIGTKTFSIAVTDSACPFSGSRTYNYSVRVSPKLDITPLFFNRTAKCDTIINIGASNTTGGNPNYNYFWNSGQKSAIIQASIGKYVLTVTDSKGCFRTQDFNIDGGIKGNISTVGACLGSSASFFDLSLPLGTNQITEREWDFGDGQKSSLENPTHLYADTGIYNVQLKVKDNKNCSIITKSKVKICLPPILKLRREERCEGENSINITNRTSRKSDCDTIRKLIVNYGFGNVITIIPNLDLLNQGRFPYPNLNLYVLNKLYLPGNYTVTAQVFYTTCSVTIQDTFKIYPKPQVGINRSDFIYECTPTTITSTELSTDYQPWKYTWTKNYMVVSTLPPTFIVDAPAKYKITVFNTIGCGVYANLDVTNAFQNTFKPGDYCEENSNISMNNARISKWGVTNWQWDFGIGNPLTSSLQNPSHIFPKDSIWIITLISTDTKGCKDTLKKAAVTYLPIGPITITSGNLYCFGEKIEIKGAYGKTISKYKWNFDANYEFEYGSSATAIDSIPVGNPRKNREPRYKFNQSNGYFVATTPFGSKNLLQQVEYNNSCVKTFSGNYTLYEPFKISADVKNLCYNQFPTSVSGIVLSSQFNVNGWKYTLSALPTPYDNAIATNLPRTFNGQNFEHQFIKHENFSLNILAEDDNFLHPCRVDTTIFRTVKKISKPDFNALGRCSGQEIVFDFTPRDAYETQDSVLFVWGDGTFTPTSGKYGTKSSDPFFKKIYNQKGNYLVKALVKTTDTENVLYGCKDSTSKTFEVLPNPKSGFTFSNPCFFQDVVFSDTSKNSSPTQTIDNSKTVWIVSQDSIFNKGKSLTYKMKDLRAVDITLVVTDNLGCKGKSMQVLTVNPAPKTEFEYSLNGNEIQLINKSKSEGLESNITKNYWEFGNGEISIDKNPIYTIKNTLEYIVLTSTNQYNCSDIDSLDLAPKYIFPTAFSPNADIVNNEAFIIYNFGIKKLNYLRIFNRWGQLVFETNDLKQGWNGTYKGVDQPVGVYQYIYELEDVFGKIIPPVQGNLTLIR